MKKYLLGIIALTVAIGFSAFTTKDIKKNRTSEYLFSYQATLNFSDSAVSNPENWALVDDDYQGIEQTCTNLCIHHACELVISSANVIDDQIVILIPVVLGTQGHFAVAEESAILHAFNGIP